MTADPGAASLVTCDCPRVVPNLINGNVALFVNS